MECLAQGRAFMKNMSERKGHGEGLISWKNEKDKEEALNWIKICLAIRFGDASLLVWSLNHPTASELCNSRSHQDVSTKHGWISLSLSILSLLQSLCFIQHFLKMAQTKNHTFFWNVASNLATLSGISIRVPHLDDFSHVLNSVHDQLSRSVFSFEHWKNTLFSKTIIRTLVTNGWVWWLILKIQSSPLMLHLTRQVHSSMWTFIRTYSTPHGLPDTSLAHNHFVSIFGPPNEHENNWPTKISLGKSFSRKKMLKTS